MGARSGQPPGRTLHTADQARLWGQCLQPKLSWAEGGGMEEMREV